MGINSGVKKKTALEAEFKYFYARNILTDDGCTITNCFNDWDNCLLFCDSIH